ncbi:CCHC-type domain-containing protein [Mycena kentingensis (nom. inval.)]|nr:CCHC-type domain-containing protein [Mycena kentingensis (nom. inval.)]
MAQPNQPNNNAAPAGQGTAAFKVPRPWESNVPKFTTDNKDDLRDFVDQVEDIIALAAITDEQEMKKLLTSYLPVRKREEWRDLAEYATGTWAEFKEAILLLYPEVKGDRDGTLDDLDTLCAEFRNIKRSEEGRLKRFGLRYRTLVTKLLKPPAVILNKEACGRYLNSLERGFAESLRTAITTRNLMKDELAAAQAQANAAVAAVHNQPAPGPNAAANAGVDRKEDPILLEELVKMAERLAKTGGGGDSTWGDLDGSEIRRSEKFPRVKLEERDARLDDLEGQVSGLRDSVETGQKQARAAHEELMKAFLSSRNAAPSREEPSGNVYRQERPYNRNGGGFGGGGGQSGSGGCYYCDDPNHFARDCALKAGHTQKGWISMEDGRQKLSDGNMIPRGPGSTAVRVEDYWKRKGAVGQNLYAEGSYGGAQLNDDEFDVLRDEIRTLRVKLNAVSVQNSAHAPNQPAYMAAAPFPAAAAPAPAPPVSNQAVPAQSVEMEALGRYMFNMMRGGSADASQQFVQGRPNTRAAAASNADPPEDRPAEPKKSNFERERRGDERAGRAVEFVETKKPGALRELPYKYVQAHGGGARTLPPPQRNVPRPALEEDAGKAYKLRAPIQRDGLTEEVLERINSTEVTVRLGDLFGLSKDLREGERTRLTRVREPLEKARDVPELVLPAHMVGVDKQIPDALTCQLADAIPINLDRDALEMGALPEVDGVFVLSTDVDGMPEGSLVAQDPYLQYLEGLREDESPKQIYVARDSVPLRVSFPYVNSQGPIECVLDSGSQIVSMSLEIAQKCGLVWDPNINIFMQSANGQLEKSMGLAKNVPFRWGELKIFLQVHVIRNPAYKVLLGRPFDVLTKSRTDHADGNHLLTLTDPNTGRAWTVPTYDRVRAEPVKKSEDGDVAQTNFQGDFHHSSGI